MFAAVRTELRIRGTTGKASNSQPQLSIFQDEVLHEPLLSENLQPKVHNQADLDTTRISLQGANDVEKSVMSSQSAPERPSIIGSKVLEQPGAASGSVFLAERLPEDGAPDTDYSVASESTFLNANTLGLSNNLAGNATRAERMLAATAPTPAPTAASRLEQLAGLLGVHLGRGPGRDAISGKAVLSNAPADIPSEPDADHAETVPSDESGVTISDEIDEGAVDAGSPLMEDTGNEQLEDSQELEESAGSSSADELTQTPAPLSAVRLQKWSAHKSRRNAPSPLGPSPSSLHPAETATDALSLPNAKLPLTTKSVRVSKESSRPNKPYRQQIAVHAATATNISLPDAPAATSSGDGLSASRGTARPDAAYSQGRKGEEEDEQPSDPEKEATVKGQVGIKAASYMDAGHGSDSHGQDPGPSDSVATEADSDRLEELSPSPDLEVDWMQSQQQQDYATVHSANEPSDSAEGQDLLVPWQEEGIEWLPVETAEDQLPSMEGQASNLGMSLSGDQDEHQDAELLLMPSTNDRLSDEEESKAPYNLMDRLNPSTDTPPGEGDAQQARDWVSQLLRRQIAGSYLGDDVSDEEDLDEQDSGQQPFKFEYLQASEEVAGSAEAEQLDIRQKEEALAARAEAARLSIPFVNVTWEALVCTCDACIIAMHMSMPARACLMPGSKFAA